MDPEWLEDRDDHDPTWSPAEAWSKGYRLIKRVTQLVCFDSGLCRYHPDGKPREQDRTALRRLSRLSSMGLHEVLEDPVAILEHDYADFEDRASTTFGLLYPNTK
jgi:hypothetical protein